MIGGEITVGGALDLPELRRGLPTVLAGSASLDRPIRWVHAGEVPNIASLLRGGELLLTTGMGIGSDAASQRRFIGELDARGVAALVIELGETFAGNLPRALIESAHSRDLPLVELRAPVRFVAVTEAIHTGIVNHHYALLQRAEELDSEFTQLMLQGRGVASVLDHLAVRLGNPVFLEGSDGRLLAHAAPGADDDDNSALEAWGKARTNADEFGASAEVLADSAHGGGRVVALPTLAPLDGFAPLALKRAANTIALAFLRRRQEEELLAVERGDLLSRVASGRVTPDVAAAQARPMGFSVARDALLLPLVARLSLVDGQPTSWTPVLRELERDLMALGTATLIGLERAQDDLLVVLALRESDQRERLASHAARLIGDRTRQRTAAEVVIAVGAPGTWSTVGDGLRDAMEATAVGVHLPAREWFDATTMALDRLLWRLRDHDDVRRYVQRMLGPVLQHDARRKHTLLPTLEALCAHGGRKAETARSLHLNRQALYGRIARLEQLLAVDLSDTRTLVALQFALESRRISGAPASN